jgi:hypothetical protein
MEKPQTFWGRVRARLVDDWHTAWRWWSIRLAALFGLIATYLLAAPETLVQVINILPPELRRWVPPALGPLITGLIVGIRLYKQGEKK